MAWKRRFDAEIQQKKEEAKLKESEKPKGLTGKEIFMRDLALGQDAEEDMATDKKDEVFYFNESLYADVDLDAELPSDSDGEDHPQQNLEPEADAPVLQTSNPPPAVVAAPKQVEKIVKKEKKSANPGASTSSASPSASPLPVLELNPAVLDKPVHLLNALTLSPKYPLQRRSQCAQRGRKRKKSNVRRQGWLPLEKI